MAETSKTCQVKEKKGEHVCSFGRVRERDCDCHYRHDFYSALVTPPPKGKSKILTGPFNCYPGKINPTP